MVRKRRAKKNQFVTIPRARFYDGKRYVLKDSFVSPQTAERLKARYKRLGYLVRTYRQGGVLHAFNRYHLYIRKL